MVHESLVSRNILCSTEIGGRKDLAIGLNLDLVTRTDPRFPGSIGKLTSLRGTSIRELVGSIIEGNKDSGTGSVDGNKGSNLITSGSSDESSGLGPDSNHGSDGPVVIDDGGSIEGVPAYGELSFSLFIGVAYLGVFLGGSLADERGVLAWVPHEVISDDINRKLSISESITTSLNSNKSSPQSLGNISTSREHISNDSPNLDIRALGSEDIFKGIVIVLLLGGGVEGSGGSSVFSLSVQGGGGCYGAEGGGGEGSSAADE
jgi:hypothetical protein